MKRKPRPRKNIIIKNRKRARRVPILPLFILGSLLAFAGMISIFLALVFSGYVYFQATGRILPGVSAGEIDLGMMTQEQAAIELHRSWALERTILVSEGGNQLMVKPETLGITADALSAAGQAYQVGREGNVFDDVGTMLDSLVSEIEIQIPVKFDRERASAGLLELVPEFSQPAKDATIRVSGSELFAVPAEVGYTIDIAGTLERIETNPGQVLVWGELQPVRMPVYPQIVDVTQALESARRMISTPLTISAYDPITNETIQREIQADTLASWLVIDQGEQGPVASLENARIETYLKQLGSELGGSRWIDGAKFSPAISAAIQQGQKATILINHKPTTYVVEAGDTLLKIGWKVGMPFWMIMKANPEVDPNAIRAGQELTIPSKDELLPHPVITNKRIVISISKQRLRAYQNEELLSEHVISTGIDRSPTQPGVFQVQTHEIEAYASVWDLYMPHFIGIYEAWPGFMNGIHGLPTLSNGQRLWANVLGRPASYGCIIMKLGAAEWLYSWAENGVVVEITP